MPTHSAYIANIGLDTLQYKLSTALFLMAFKFISKAKLLLAIFAPCILVWLTVNHAEDWKFKQLKLLKLSYQRAYWLMPPKVIDNRRRKSEVFQNNDSEFTKQSKYEKSKKANFVETKLILAYTTVYGKLFTTELFRKKGEVNSIPDPFSKCDYKCKWSNNKAHYKRSDAVIFHLYNLDSIHKEDGHGEFAISNLPTRYSTDQKWVLMIREPGSFFYPQQLKLLDNKFNLTMTFQSDSDVVIPYGGYSKLSPSELEKYANIDYITGKSKMVAWLVSNCITSSRREDYVRELQKYMQVDVYGKCNSFNSSPGDQFMIAQNYKFYLAFENSDCDDYITEKFWWMLSLGMIPVVRGERANYRMFAPPNSYIHVDWFETPKELAQHLIDVSLKPLLLQKYHQWRKTYRANFRRMPSNWYCDLCEKVHTSPPKTVDVYKHFSEDTRCNVFDRNRDRTGEQMQNIEH